MEIEVRRRSSTHPELGYVAHVKGRNDAWGTGDNVPEAIGSLIIMLAGHNITVEPTMTFTVTQL
jgi:hypothetical protein